MSIEGPTLLGGDLPPIDHVARALLKRGARREAVALLRATVERDPGEKACAALLRAVEARPDASVYGPEVRLDLRLAELLARAGWLREARALLRGAGLEGTTGGGQLAQHLDVVLRPSPAGASQGLASLDHQIQRGEAAVVLAALDTAVGLPPWAQERRSVLRRLLLEGAPAALAAGPVAGGTSEFAAAIRPHLDARDFRGAAAAAAAHAEDSGGSPVATAGAEALRLVVQAFDETSGEFHAGMLRTTPMSGHQVALFQLAMGNFEASGRFLRKLLLDDPEDSTARQRLRAIEMLQAALEGRVLPGVVPAKGSSLPEQSPPTGPPLEGSQPSSRASHPRGSNAPFDAPSAVEDAPSVPQSAPPRQRYPNPPPRPLAPPPDPLPRLDAGSSDEEGPTSVRQGPPLGALLKPPQTEAPTVDRHDLAAGAPSSPELLDKRRRRPTGDDRYQSQSPPLDAFTDDVSTELSTPENHAELLLKQGFAENALTIYDALAARFPERGDYSLRAKEIRELVERRESQRPPPPSSVDLGLAPTPPAGADASAVRVPVVPQGSLPETPPSGSTPPGEEGRRSESLESEAARSSRFGERTLDSKSEEQPLAPSEAVGAERRPPEDDEGDDDDREEADSARFWNDLPTEVNEEPGSVAVHAIIVVK